MMISKTPHNVTTAGELFALPSDGNRYELVEGVLRMMSPAGNEHGIVATAIGASLYNHVKKCSLGKVYAAETGFLIASKPDTVRAPDAAFVSSDRLNSTEPVPGYLALAPNLVVEVVSPHDVFSEVEDMAAQWLDAGSQMVVVANPKDQSLRIYRDRDSIQILKPGDTFDSGSVCSNWLIKVDNVFE